MAFLSSTCTYAIRAALQVAIERPNPGEFVSTRHVAEVLGVPFAFLTKVLQGLVQSGILVSQRGSTGGVALGRPAAGITLLDIVASVSGDGVFRECLLGLPECSNTAPCAMHTTWQEQRSRLEQLFTQTTLADLAARSESSLSLEQTKPAADKPGRGRTVRRPS